MRTAIAVFLAIMFVNSGARSQDLSSFYAITGFRLPALRAGQYALSISPHYSIRPSDFASLTNSTSTTTTPTTSSTTNSNSLTSYYTPNSGFSASSDVIYGISDQTTFSFGVSYLPYHTFGTRNSLSSNSSSVVPPSSLTNTTTTGTTEFREQSLASTLVVAHRFQPNVELSLAASWSYTKSPYIAASNASGMHDSGGVTPTLSSTISSSNDFVSSNAHAFDISATLVIRGY